MTVSQIRKLYGNTPKEEILNAYNQTPVDAVDEFEADDSLLHLACSKADAEAVELLLQKGLNPNVRNRYGQTPLHALARIDDRYVAFSSEDIRRCADMLIDAKANLTRKDDDSGHTPITMAGMHGRFELLQSAADHGGRVTNTDKDGNNALHLACNYIRHVISSLEYAREEDEKAHINRRIDQFYKSAQALLSAGIDLDAKNDNNRTALEIAIESKANKIASLLKNGGVECDNETDAQTGGMNLLQAVINNAPDSIRANVGLGADLNELSDDDKFKGLTALAIACYTWNLPNVELLLSLGADPNFKDSDGRTAIAKWFAYLGDFHLNMRDATNKIPVKILKALLSAGMDINAPINDKSDTPLLGACKVVDSGRTYMSLDVANALVNAGGNPNISDLDGVTPIMVICGKSGDGIENLAADLIDAGADVNATDKNGNTALHYAAGNRSQNAGNELASILFDNGFENTDAVNNDGKSAMEIATDNQNEPLVKLILTNS